MTKTNSLKNIDGRLRRVELVIYTNGTQVKRIYDVPNPVPFEIIWVKPPQNPDREINWCKALI
jgi:hypothetical protein